MGFRFRRNHLTISKLSSGAHAASKESKWFIEEWQERSPDLWKYEPGSAQAQ
jgi:hypothetical protein